jgi:hypothetical protein
MKPLVNFIVAVIRHSAKHDKERENKDLLKMSGF